MSHPAVKAATRDVGATVAPEPGQMNALSAENPGAPAGSKITPSPIQEQKHPGEGDDGTAIRPKTHPAVRLPTASEWANGADDPGNQPNLGARPVESNGRMQESDKRAVTAAHETPSTALRTVQPAPQDRHDQPKIDGRESQTTTGAGKTPGNPAGPDQPDHRHVIALDGAAAAGKTTVARELAARLKVTLFDTGVLYRAATLAALQRSVALDSADRMADLAANLDIRVGRPTVDDGRLYDVVVDGADVTWAIRAAEVDQHVSQVSAHGLVRHALLPVQRTIADGAAVVMVGRDIGTVVTPAAGVKIFLSASLKERARRRHAELRGRGEEVDLDFIVADLERRDAIDSARDVSPLKAADDAILVDTDGRSVDDVVTEIEGIVRTAWSALT